MSEGALGRYASWNTPFFFCFLLLVYYDSFLDRYESMLVLFLSLRLQLFEHAQSIDTETGLD